MGWISKRAVVGHRARSAALATVVVAGAVAALSGPAAPPAWAASTSVDAFGSAAAVNAASPTGLQAPVVGIATTPDGNGYWVTTSAGEVGAAGDAPPLGSAAGMSLTAPVVGMAATPDGGGYRLAAADGGVFTYGDAHFYGSAGNLHLAAPIVGMAATPDGAGYWLTAADGGVFTYGDAHFYGSAGNLHLAAPIVGMAATLDGAGYWLAARDGGVFTYGDAPFAGSGAGGATPVNAIAGRPGGYWLARGLAPADIAPGSGLRLQQLLAALGYLPVSWPAGAPSNPLVDGPMAAYSSPVGAFPWWWTSPPPSLAAQWAPGQDTAMVRGAVMAFEARAGLPIDGVASQDVWSALFSAAADPAVGANQVGYSYALASTAVPENMTVWHNGAVVVSTLVNTGIPQSPTARGTYSVYERLAYQVMRGVNPNGSAYADPVQWVAYFNGSDAVHYIPRSSWGYPQSLGCIETPYTAAATAWPYLTYGTLVTVQ